MKIDIYRMVRQVPELIGSFEGEVKQMTLLVNLRPQQDSKYTLATKWVTEYQGELYGVVNYFPEDPRLHWPSITVA